MSDDDYNYDEIEEQFKRAILRDKAEESKNRRKKKKKKIVFNPKPLIFIIIVVSLVFGIKSLLNKKKGENTIEKVKLETSKTENIKTEPVKNSESINKQLVDEVVYKDFVEDTTLKRYKKHQPIQVKTQVNSLKETSKSTKQAVESVTSGEIKAMTSEEIEKNMPKKGTYTIQIAAGKVLDGSKTLAENLVKAGYPAQCVKEGNMYRVLIGSFKTREEAIIYGNSLQSKRVIKYFYPRYKN